MKYPEIIFFMYLLKLKWTPSKKPVFNNKLINENQQCKSNTDLSKINYNLIKFHQQYENILTKINYKLKTKLKKV